VKTPGKTKDTESRCVTDVPQKATNSSNPEQKIGTSFSLPIMHGILKGFSLEKKKLVQSIGFGILLQLSPQSKFPRQLALWILRNMDSTNGQIILPNGVKLVVNDYDVELVLGIPRKDKIVKCGLQVSSEDVSTIRKILMLNHEEEITLQCVERILTKEYGATMSIKEQEAFKVALVLCADAYFLAPRGSNAKIN
jgi:hypothetical protein